MSDQNKGALYLLDKVGGGEAAFEHTLNSLNSDQTVEAALNKNESRFCYSVISRFQCFQNHVVFGCGVTKFLTRLENRGEEDGEGLTCTNMHDQNHINHIKMNNREAQITTHTEGV